MENSNTLTVQRDSLPVMVPQWVIRAGDILSPSARTLYAIICSYINTNDGSFRHPGWDTISDHLGLHSGDIPELLEELEEVSAITYLPDSGIMINFATPGWAIADPDGADVDE